MKKFFQKLGIFSIALANCLIFGVNTSFAAINQDSVCNVFLKYQYISVAPSGPQDPATADQAKKEKDELTAKYKADFSDKIVVVTEEPLGTPDGTNSFKCYRLIKCTGVMVDGPKAANTKDLKGKTIPAKPAERVLVRRCETTFTSDSGQCSGAKSSSELAGTFSLKENDKITICEPVMAYVSGAGTELLYFYIGAIYRYAASIGGLIAVLTMIFAGILRTTAGDNTEQVSKANGLITKCISGLVVLFLSAVILYTINPNFFVI